MPNSTLVDTQSNYHSIGNYIVKRYENGETSLDLEEQLLEFLYPYDTEDREKEVDIYMRYHKQSTLLIIFDEDKIVATVRCIFKRSNIELLPIESAKVLAIVNPLVSNCLKSGYTFRASVLPRYLPCAEVGGLKVSNDIPKVDQHRLIYYVLDACEKEVYKNLCIWAFITCSNTPQFIKLYTDKMLFNELVTVSYGYSDSWMALYRFMLNPVA